MAQARSRSRQAGAVARRLPVGAEPVDGGAHFRVWAPKRRRVAVEIEGCAAAVPLAAEAGGWFAGFLPGASAGRCYRYVLDGDLRRPDPASRFQPEGPHGPSMIVDPSRYEWRDAAWRGVRLEGQVLYELHVGTFTAEGTWAAAERELPALAELGVTVLELLPIADFPGRFGWGYDGVNLFAPTRLYGTPDDARRFVDRAHALGLGVILDVVYNHFGPAGNYLRDFADAWFTDRYENEWGDAIDFDGPASAAVREHVVANAGYWVDEFHVDGLRLDATQQIFDASPTHVLVEIGERVRAAARGRGTLLVGENEPQRAELARPVGQGGCGLDALWNDDFHHSAVVALTGRNPAYYGDYLGSERELVALARHGFLYQGQRYLWQGKRRGTPAAALAPAQLVTYLQNHDQVANSARGERLHRLADPARLRAATAFALLAPGTPMLFMGQEFASSAPFLYFADHEPDLAPKVREGRTAFLSQFPDIALPATRALLADPGDERTMRRCVLDHDERGREPHRAWWELHRDLLRLRRDDPTIAGAVERRGGVDGAPLGDGALVLRYFGTMGDDRLLLVNLGRARALVPAPEPLLAPPPGRAWRVRWTSDDVRYGGTGTPEPETADGWRLPGATAVLLAPGAERNDDAEGEEGRT
jgi:maltooligosyltrehalose trehalohydrolase